MLPGTPQSIHDWNVQAPVPDELQDKEYATFNEKQRTSFWNKERNWLKHNNPSRPDDMKISRVDAESMIARAISHLPETLLAPEHDALLRTFFGLWFHDVGWKPPAG
jgi:hypothetical protein